jgi:hypothetical protein
LVGVAPIFVPLSSIRKTGLILICSLWRKFVEISWFSVQTRKTFAPARGDARRGTTGAGDAPGHVAGARPRRISQMNDL